MKTTKKPDDVLDRIMAVYKRFDKQAFKVARSIHASAGSPIEIDRKWRKWMLHAEMAKAEIRDLWSKYSQGEPQIEIEIFTACLQPYHLAIRRRVFLFKHLEVNRALWGKTPKGINPRTRVHRG